MTTRRIELKQCSVIFNEEDHTYYLPEKKKFLSGITGMLERQLYPDTYAGIPEAVLSKAAEYGTSVHQSIEDFDMDWLNDGTQEVADYISLTTEQGLVHEISEYLITDEDTYASMIDKVYRVDGSTFDIADLKTYGVMTPEKREAACWQLSIYAYLFELQNKKAKVRRMFILHIRNKQKQDGSFDHIADFIELSRIPSEICKELLDADKAGEQFQNPYAIPEDIRSQEGLIRELIQTKQEAEEKLNRIKSKILKAMEEQDIRTWSTENMKITRRLPSTKSSFNLTAFKEANPNMDLSAFMRTSQVAGSPTIAI